MTASFVPLLSKFQDDGATYRRYVRKITGYAAFIMFPVMLGIAAIGSPLFHTLFGNKWDAAIPLFQILTIRGIFVILISLYNNFLLALGYAKRLVIVEIIKDALVFVAIFATVWFHSVELLVWGQLWASMITWAIVLIMTSRAIGISAYQMVRRLVPFALGGIVMAILSLLITMLPVAAAFQLIAMLVTGVLAYVTIARVMRWRELSEALAYLLGRFRKNRR